MTSPRSIDRLILYRRQARTLLEDGAQRVFSHELAEGARCTASQVRRDLMGLDFSGSPNKGYPLEALITALDKTLDPPSQEGMAVFGVGRIGRSLLHYYEDHPGPVRIVAAFDKDSRKSGRVLCGCPVHHMDELESVLTRSPIRVAIIAVPEGAAQATAQRLVAVGVRSFLNFSPIRLRLPAGTFVEFIDFTSALEKLAILARRSATQELS